jgi:hypothetical protein
LLYQRGRTWWVQYFVNGRRVRESAETTNRRAAQDFLNGRLGHVVQGKPILPRVDRVRYDELAADLRRHYETTGTRSLVEADKRLEPFKAFFTGCRASAIGTADVTTYVERRQLAGQRHDQPQARDARPSVAVRDAAGSPEAAQTPVIRLLKKAPPRAGFFEAARFAAVRQRLRPDLQVTVTLAYTLGWRMQSEMLSLDRRHGRPGCRHAPARPRADEDGRAAHCLPHPRARPTPRRAARAGARPRAALRPGHPIPVPAHPKAWRACRSPDP